MKTGKKGGLIMAIDVLIKQKLFSNKTMPLEVILGNKLHYGDYVNYQLEIGVMGETEFIAYNPKSIGRGFSVIWNPKENKSISLRLPMPSTVQEIKDFYEAVERMVNYWNGKLIVDDHQMALANFIQGFDDMVNFNRKVIKEISQRVLDTGHSQMLPSAMWELTIGEREAKLFLENSNDYSKWLHEKQSLGVNYKVPRFFMGPNGIFGVYLLFNDEPSLFPYRPMVPFGITDNRTGKALECKEWQLWPVIKGDKSSLCKMEYDQFMNLLPESKKKKYDDNRFLLDDFTVEDLKELVLKYKK